MLEQDHQRHRFRAKGLQVLWPRSDGLIEDAAHAKRLRQTHEALELISNNSCHTPILMEAIVYPDDDLVQSDAAVTQTRPGIKTQCHACRRFERLDVWVGLRDCLEHAASFATGLPLRPT
jgi:hypothetical protein